MLSYWIDLGFFYTVGDMSWRFPIAFQILFAVVMIGFLVSGMDILVLAHLHWLTSVRVPSARVPAMARFQGQTCRGSIRPGRARRNFDGRQEGTANIPRNLRCCSRRGFDRVLNERAVDTWQVAKLQADVVGCTGTVFPADFRDQVSHPSQPYTTFLTTA